MKDILQWLIVFFVVLFIVAAMSGNSYSMAIERNNNLAIKQCLELYGYTSEKFDVFPWNKASRCFTEYDVAQQKVELQATRDFLEKNPWYKGKNWNWEDRAEFTCHTEYHTGEIYCHRPKYIKE